MCMCVRVCGSFYRELDAARQAVAEQRAAVKVHVHVLHSYMYMYIVMDCSLLYM